MGKLKGIARLRFEAERTFTEIESAVGAARSTGAQSAEHDGLDRIAFRVQPDALSHIARERWA